MIFFFKKTRKMHSLFNILNGLLVDLPSPINISNFWNFGSLLGFFLFLQIITGLILASHFSPNVEQAFSSLDHISRDISMGWCVRILHLNGASFFFIFLYVHIGRGLYYHSSCFQETWNIGIIIFFFSMMLAFVGYVLPWGQMSFWGATVITNLVSAIPIIGKSFVLWIWGNFAVSNSTLNRFFMLHFCVPFIILGMVIIHIFFLHSHGSSNPIGCDSNVNFIPFHWYFSLKDISYFFLWFFLFFLFTFLMPFILGDPENFILANPLSTPIHIVPEWYFLFAYAILRAIPNKLIGVIALGISLLILFLPPMFSFKKKGFNFLPLTQICFFLFLGSFLLLTWLGGKIVESPFIEISQCLVFIYFFSFLLIYFALLIEQNTFQK